jgi:hypothetical protein
MKLKGFHVKVFVIFLKELMLQILQAISLSTIIVIITYCFSPSHVAG